MKLYNVIPVSFLLLFFFNSLTGFSQKRIAVIGSSSAYGYFPSASGIPRDSAWASKIKKHFKDLNIIDTLFNLGQSSTDCFEGMPSSYTPPSGFNYRLPNPNINITRAVNLLPKPDVIIVNYPTNNYDWIPNAQIIACLQTIKDSANANNIKCFITTTQPREGFSPAERLKLKTLRDLILNQFGEWAIDFYTDIVQEPALSIKTIYSIGDGVHLNPAGHTICKGKVLEKNLFFVLVPVRFGELRATAQAETILLQWQTLNQYNNKHFIIQNSRDGLNFLPLATLKGTLNSAVSLPYSYKDIHPLEGQNYYRVVAVSTQDQKEFSNIISVKFKKQTTGVVSIKNTSTLIQLSFAETPEKPIWAGLYNMQGKLILTCTLPANNSNFHSINIAGLLSGKYILQLQLKDHKETFQLMKL